MKITKQNLMVSAPFLLAGTVYLLLNLFVVTPERWQFAYGAVYAVAFFAIGAALAFKELNWLDSLLVSLIAFLTIFVSAGVFPADISMWLAVLLLVPAVASAFLGKPKSSAAGKGLMFTPFIFILIYSVSTLVIDYTTPRLTPGLTWVTLHVGIAALAFGGATALAGWKGKYTQYVLWIGLLLTVIAAAVQVNSGGGLSLI